MVRKRSCFGLPSSVTKDTSGKLFVCFFSFWDLMGGAFGLWRLQMVWSFMYTESSFECLGVESWCEDVAAPVILLAWLMVWESFYLRDAMWGPTRWLICKATNMTKLLSFLSKELLLGLLGQSLTGLRKWQTVFQCSGLWKPPPALWIPGGLRVNGQNHQI